MSQPELIWKLGPCRYIFKMKLHWSKMDPQSKMTGTLTKKKKGKLDTDTHTGRIPFEGENRDWDEASTSQGMPKISSKPPETRGELWNIFSLVASEGTSFVNT